MPFFAPLMMSKSVSTLQNSLDVVIFEEKLHQRFALLNRTFEISNPTLAENARSSLIRFNEHVP